MAFVRFTIDGAVPKDAYDALSSATKTSIRDKFLQLKALCRKINKGLPNEEATVSFKWHVCRHDEGLPCDQEQNI